MPNPLILFGAFDRHNFVGLAQAQALWQALSVDAHALQQQAESLAA